ncbi:MAG: sulfite exporter TauE/SafE family protein [Myxococcales bacterium]|nr:sulfite exporter TauE/SafE family protein [Myxococcales bacterium]
MFEIDPYIALVGLPIGLVVGLTGMGGGALLTPLLILGFGVDPLTAISSDLVASLFMKPVGGAVHLKSGTVRTDIVKLLMWGSMPSAVVGVLLLKLLFHDDHGPMKTMLGWGLLVVLLSMVARRIFGQTRPIDAVDTDIKLRPLPTLLAGVVGGLIVGLTSVGSGSLIIASLMIIYPRMSMRGLIGTDLVQAVPLVGAAALAHVFFGDVKLSLTLSLLIGAIPGVYIGARISSTAKDGLMKPIIMVLLAATGVKLLGVGNLTALAVAAGVSGALFAEALLRRKAAPVVDSEPR